MNRLTIFLGVFLVPCAGLAASRELKTKESPNVRPAAVTQVSSPHVLAAKHKTPHPAQGSHAKNPARPSNVDHVLVLPRNNKTLLSGKQVLGVSATPPSGLLAKKNGIAIPRNTRKGYSLDWNGAGSALGKLGGEAGGLMGGLGGDGSAIGSLGPILGFPPIDPSKLIGGDTSTASQSIQRPDAVVSDEVSMVKNLGKTASSTVKSSASDLGSTAKSLGQSVQSGLATAGTATKTYFNDKVIPLPQNTVQQATHLPQDISRTTVTAYDDTTREVGRPWVYGVTKPWNAWYGRQVTTIADWFDRGVKGGQQEMSDGYSWIPEWAAGNDTTQLDYSGVTGSGGSVTYDSTWENRRLTLPPAALSAIRSIRTKKGTPSRSASSCG